MRRTHDIDFSSENGSPSWRSARPSPARWRSRRSGRRYLRRQIDSGAERRGVPHTPVEKAALDYVDELTSRDDLRLDMDFVPGDIQLCNNDTILHARTSFVDGRAPHQKRHLLRLWLKFPTPWPIGPHFPEHKGYAASGSKALVEV